MAIIIDQSVFETYYKQVETHLRNSDDGKLKFLLEELKDAHERHVRELEVVIDRLVDKSVVV